MAQMNFGGVVENVMTREEFPLEKAREILKDETIAVIGYGVQGPGQSLNLRDNGFNVIVGQRQGKTYEKAVEDGWVPGETLFGIEEACDKATIIMCLLSDAAVMSVWPTMKPYLTAGKALYFSHGFAITWNDRTGVVPPADIDVIMVAPKGSGTSLRSMFLEGRGLNSSFAIYQDATGKAMDRTLALGIGIGSGYLFETTFIREATSDLTGERGSLMGAIQGLLLAQYEVLRENGHTPSEAFNETVEELTQSLMPLFAKNGMDWMYANCSTTAQRGALDWMGPFHDAIKPVVEKLYANVKCGNEAQISIDSNSKPDYREKLEAELTHKSKELASSTMLIINKNKVLQVLKDELTAQKEALGTQYPNKYYNKLVHIIDENIGSDNDWEVFQTNFDRIHEGFFRKLKATYPDLTANDLKLCAFLRLNLSTKDIAHLMNISVRGVEMGRYRVRKKLNISSEENLVEFMIEFK